jgi:hypothetical protein
MILDNDPLPENIYARHKNLLAPDAQLHATESKIRQNGFLSMVLHCVRKAAPSFLTLAKPQSPQN